MVDDVCLYHARLDFVNHKYLSQINDLEGSADLEEKQQLEDMMRKELEGITLRSVPPKIVTSASKKGAQYTAQQSTEESNTAKNKKNVAVDIKNEMEIAAGKFGWCIMCRG